LSKNASFLGSWPKKTYITDQQALDFHAKPVPGKLALRPTKPMATQRDLSLAYSPGVAVPVEEIAKDPDLAYDYTHGVQTCYGRKISPL